MAENPSRWNNLTGRLSHQHGKDIPKALFYKMLKQAQITEEHFKKLSG
jgi:hypothetical protein